MQKQWNLWLTTALFSLILIMHNQFLQQLLQVLGIQPTQLVSPIPQGDFEDNNNQALQQYYNRENVYIPPHQAQQALDANQAYYAKQPNLLYNPAIANAPTPIPRTDMSTSLPGVNPQTAQLYFNLLGQTLPVTRAYDIPDAVTAVQMAQESSYGQKPAGKNNYFGLKAHSYPGFAHFDTPQQGAEYYAQTIKALVPNLKQLKNNPMGVLKAMQSGKQRYEGDNPNPMQYVYDVSQNPVWKAYGQQPMAINPRGWK